MRTQEIEQLVEYLNKIINKTENGAMVWGRQNPTTFTWTDNASAMLILQKVAIHRGGYGGGVPLSVYGGGGGGMGGGYGGMGGGYGGGVPVSVYGGGGMGGGYGGSAPDADKDPKGDKYLFNVIERPSNKQILTLDTEETPDFFDPLAQLYDLAALSITKNGLDVLRKIVDE